MGSCQLLATPNGTWTAGAMSLAPSRCRSWSSKNRCGRSAWIIMVLSWPSMKATSSTLTPMDFSVLMTLASAGMPLLVMTPTRSRGEYSPFVALPCASSACCIAASDRMNGPSGPSASGVPRPQIVRLAHGGLLIPNGGSCARYAQDPWAPHRRLSRTVESGVQRA